MARETQKIVVMGLGYIGLPTASMLATKGHQVLGVDVNQKAVDTINSGRIHIVEPDLDMLVRSAVNSGNLRAADGARRGRHLHSRRAHALQGSGWQPQGARPELCGGRHARHRALPARRQPGDSRVHLAGGHHRGH